MRLDHVSEWAAVVALPSGQAFIVRQAPHVITAVARLDGQALRSASGYAVRPDHDLGFFHSVSNKLMGVNWLPVSSIPLRLSFRPLPYLQDIIGTLGGPQWLTFAETARRAMTAKLVLLSQEREKKSVEDQESVVLPA